MTTSPYLFTDQAISSTGQMEWDEFSGGNYGAGTFGTFAPDVEESGGTGSININFTPIPGDNPPLPLVTSTENIYVGGTFSDFDVDIAGLDASGSNTTVVMQLGVIGGINPFSILMDGTAPTSFVDRGTAPDVFHNTDAGGGAPFDTTYYWAEWQVASSVAHTLEFTNLFPHTSIAQVRVDYYNSNSVFDAAEPGQVPEPTAATLLAAIGGTLFVRRRRNV
ncbi:MAG: PEP-CTERM sorting domain-containing protein [Planctomycetota bacterium]